MADCKTPEDLKAILEHIHGKYKDGADKMSLEEKKKHCDMLQNVLRMVGSMENELRKSVDISDQEGMILQMRGNLHRDKKGSVIVPDKDQVQAAFVIGGTKKSPAYVQQASVDSVFFEKNFNHIMEGPASPNFLLQNVDVFIKFASAKDAATVLELEGCRAINSARADGVMCAQMYKFVTPPSFVARATYRNIGHLITRLKEVDDQLKTLGAVAGSSGTPRLSKHLLSVEDFDAQVNEYTLRNNKEFLHEFLTTKTRVDKRKRQTALEPLVDERIEILMQLSKIDQDKFPFTFEREFKV